jgi:hypothetical protein
MLFALGMLIGACLGCLATALVVAASRSDRTTRKNTKTVADSECYCYNCNKDRIDENSQLPYVMTRMIVCPACGNKRCPHSTDHNLACTGSNEPGQPGSRYE